MNCICFNRLLSTFHLSSTIWHSITEGPLTALRRHVDPLVNENIRENDTNIVSALAHLSQNKRPQSITLNTNWTDYELLIAWIKPLAVLQLCNTQETSIIKGYLSLVQNM